ncbi:hypothetical protein Vafri_20814 [Volvox africanus]|uniref:Peptidase M11 gametolysin domain-containing protein n=1 Tax=Volvox africanus TaxID=51714 RepID=A0A8J4FB14_9CHLO|nr:hypothetical protein Vafri_20814 [Volvox africanus]
MRSLIRGNQLGRLGGHKAIRIWWSEAVCITSMLSYFTYFLLVILQLAFLPSSTLGRRILADDAQGVLQGTITSLELYDSRPTYYLDVYGASGAAKIFHLEFCESVHSSSVLLGILVNVPYDKIENGVVHSCSVPTEPAQDSQPSRPRRLLLGESITSPLEPRILIYVPTLCGYNKPPAVSKEDVIKLFISGDSTNRSLARYFRTCSYGQVNLLESNIKVLIPPQEIPCTGTLPPGQPFEIGPNFTTRACNEHDNLPKWHYWLDSWAATIGVDAAEYHQRVLILPRDFTWRIPGCNSFAGLATSGRWQYWSRTGVNNWGTSLIWLPGDSFGRLEILLHEIGHTYGMAHASIPGGCDTRDQCDHTCTMGATGGQAIRCLNAAHNWQIGWGRPFLELDDASLPYGMPSAPIRIPKQLSSINSSVVVTGAGMPDNQRLFLSVRMNVYPYDLAWKYSDDNTPFVLVHTYNGTDRSFYHPSFHIGEIRLGMMWRDTEGGSILSVRFDSWDADTGASVRICRRASDTELNCNDGLDEDCDFLTDNEDPDCRKGAGSGSGSGIGTTVRKAPQFSQQPWMPVYRRSPPPTIRNPLRPSGPIAPPRRPKVPKSPPPPPPPPPSPRRSAFIPQLSLPRPPPPLPPPSPPSPRPSPSSPPPRPSPSPPKPRPSPSPSPPRPSPSPPPPRPPPSPPPPRPSPSSSPPRPSPSSPPLAPPPPQPHPPLAPPPPQPHPPLAPPPPQPHPPLAPPPPQPQPPLVPPPPQPHPPLAPAPPQPQPPLAPPPPQPHPPLAPPPQPHPPLAPPPQPQPPGAPPPLSSQPPTYGGNRSRRQQ